MAGLVWPERSGPVLRCAEVVSSPNPHPVKWHVVSFHTTSPPANCSAKASSVELLLHTSAPKPVTVVEWTCMCRSSKQKCRSQQSGVHSSPTPPKQIT